jgi:hypothetical protein
VDQLRLERLHARSDEGWEHFIDRVPEGLLFHRLTFLSYHPPERFREHHLRARSGNHLVGVISLAEIDGPAGLELASPYGASFGGWVASPELAAEGHLELLRLLVDYGRGLGVSALNIGSRPTPYRGAGDLAEFALVSHGATVSRQEITHIAPLEGSADDVRRRLRPSSRRAVRKAEKTGIEVRHAGCADLPRFHALLTKNLERKSARPTHTLAELEDLFGRHPDGFHLHLAENQGNLIGGNLLVRCSSRIWLSFYVAREEGAPGADWVAHLLMERAVFAAQVHGCAWLDFGTTSINGVMNPGLCQFKEGFGGIPFQRLTWRLEI